jgi:hypothetical protein
VARSISGIAVATLDWSNELVERESSDRSDGWRPLRTGDAVRTGDRIRTGPEAVARIRFPWVTVTAGAYTTFHIPAAVVLSAVLDEGRVELEAGESEIMRLRTAEAEVRGTGHIVVRRMRAQTTVMAMALSGTFRVEAGGRRVELAAGQGLLIRDGGPPSEPMDLPPPPEDPYPAGDPVYVRQGEAARFSWKSPYPDAHLQVLALDSDAVLLDRDLGPPPQEVVVPWLGTWRWRVSVRDPRGLEGRATPPGYIVVVDR